MTARTLTFWMPSPNQGWKGRGLSGPSNAPDWTGFWEAMSPVIGAMGVAQPHATHCRTSQGTMKTVVCRLNPDNR
jgi:hypothetical protein